MSNPFTTAADSLLCMVPGLAVGLLACLAWYVVCRLMMRRQDAEWYAALPALPEAEQSGNYDAQIRAAELRLASLHVHACALACGKPSDRLFAFGLFVTGVIAMAGIFVLLVIT